MRITRSFLVALALIVPFAAFHASPAQAGASVSLGFFYDSLSPHGNWYASVDFGYVWRPAHVSIGWRPYVDGRWAYSNVGWTFVSHDPWGWATYHYGRWYLDPFYGWVWVPGYEWAPAWVTFYEGPGWIGWAPLPPRVSIGVVYASPIRIDPRAYCFVESRYFLDPYVGRRIQPVASNTRLVRAVRDVSRFDRVGGVVVNRGLGVDRVERATKARVRTFRLVDQTDVRRASRAELRGDSLTVFRPRVEKGAARPSKVSQGRPARFEAAPQHATGAGSVGRKPEPGRGAPPARLERPATPTRTVASPSGRSTVRSTERSDRSAPSTRAVAPSTARTRAESVAPHRTTTPERSVSRVEPKRGADVQRAAPSASEPGRRWTTERGQPGSTVRTEPEAKSDPRSSKAAAPTPTKKSAANAKDRSGRKATSKPEDRKPPRLG